MRKITLIFLTLFLSINFVVYAQKNINEDATVQYQTALKENIFIHYNSSFLLTGENLYYKVYCIKTRTNRLSNISKIAYVELIDSNKKLIFKHKIRLKSGFGDGYFFIPTSIKSGNYKLIAYTQWMRNEGNNYFYQEDISIVNPFKENQKAVLKVEESRKVISNIYNKQKIKEVISKYKSDFLELRLTTNNFKKREKVSLKIHSLKNENSFGEYSISIRKIDTFNTLSRKTATTYSFLYPKKQLTSQVNKGSVFLPELKGELLSGKVLLKETQKPAVNIKVTLSIPENRYVLKFATTNNLGEFNFNLEMEYESSNVVIQVLGDNRRKYELLLSKQLPLNYDKLTFTNYNLESIPKDLLLEYSIQNQIENAYLGMKKDTISSIKPLQELFNTNLGEDYILDDYTRFSTIKETVLEIVKSVWISRKKGNYIFHMRNKELYEKNVFLPLVIVDGFLIQNFNELVNYNAKKVKKINVIEDKFTFDSYTYQGVISIETFDKNYERGFSDSYIKNIKLFKVLSPINYFNQVYDGSNKLDRIPDYRRQLLWKPNLSLNKKETIITFYTPDNKGDYEISLEGFNSEGNPISLRKIISVK